MTIRVVIADDQQLIRAGFKMILSAEPDITVVGEANTGSEAIDLTRELRPDVILMDIRMPDLDGIEATRRILALDYNPPPSVLILTTFDLDEYVYEALRAGETGSCSKTYRLRSSPLAFAPSVRATRSSLPASRAD